jgi:hypothetical protein
VNLNSRLDIPVAASLRSSASERTKRETSANCRERAAADLLSSVAMLNAHQRARMETSAAMWTQRAEMLQRVEDSVAQRAAVTAASDEAASALLRDEKPSQTARF